MKNSLFLFTLITVLFAIGCEGPAGPTGPRGLQGLQGPAGADGADGNANVKGSLYTATSSDWGSVSGSYSVTLLNSNITQSIMDKGAVMVYVYTTSNGWENLPYVYGSNQFYARHFVGYVRVYSTSTTNPGSVSFKVVVIASLNKEQL